MIDFSLLVTACATYASTGQWTEHLVKSAERHGQRVVMLYPSITKGLRRGSRLTMSLNAVPQAAKSQHPAANSPPTPAYVQAVQDNPLPHPNLLLSSEMCHPQLREDILAPSLAHSCVGAP